MIAHLISYGNVSGSVIGIAEIRNLGMSVLPVLCHLRILVCSCCSVLLSELCSSASCVIWIIGEFGHSLKILFTHCFDVHWDGN